MTAPSAPVITFRGATPSSVRLRWAAVTGAATYRVYKDATLYQTGLTALLTVVQCSELDALTVTAVNAGAEESAVSNTVTVGALSSQGHNPRSGF